MGVSKEGLPVYLVRVQDIQVPDNAQNHLNFSMKMNMVSSNLCVYVYVRAI